MHPPFGTPYHLSWGLLQFTLLKADFNQNIFSQAYGYILSAWSASFFYCNAFFVYLLLFYLVLFILFLCQVLTCRYYYYHFTH